MHGISTIDSECLTDYEAGCRATQPKNGSSDLLRPTKSANRHLSHQLFHGFRLSGQHARDHRRLDNARANCVDANATRGIFESSALREPEDSVLGGVIGSTAI